MSKLIKRYLADRNMYNVNRLKEYARKHPFAVCLCSNDELKVLKELGIA